MSTEQKIIKNKIGLLKLAEELGNVSRACKVMGYSRDTFYRYRQAVEEGGFEALVTSTLKGPPIAAARARGPGRPRPGRRAGPRPRIAR